MFPPFSLSAVEYVTDVLFDKLEHSLQTVTSLPQPALGETIPLSSKANVVPGKKEL